MSKLKTITAGFTFRADDGRLKEALIRLRYAVAFTAVNGFERAMRAVMEASRFTDRQFLELQRRAEAAKRREL